MTSKTIARCVTVSLVAAAPLTAQTDAARSERMQEQLRQLRAEKRAKPVFAIRPWTFDFDEAQRLAHRSGKPIFAYFTRSYSP